MWGFKSKFSQSLLQSGARGAPGLQPDGFSVSYPGMAPVGQCQHSRGMDSKLHGWDSHGHPKDLGTQVPKSLPEGGGRGGPKAASGAQGSPGHDPVPEPRGHKATSLPRPWESRHVIPVIPVIPESPRSRPRTHLPAVSRPCQRSRPAPARSGNAAPSPLVTPLLGGWPGTGHRIDPSIPHPSINPSIHP